MGSYKHRKKRVYAKGKCEDCGGVFLACNMIWRRCQRCYRIADAEGRTPPPTVTYMLNNVEVDEQTFKRATEPRGPDTKTELTQGGTPRKLE